MDFYSINLIPHINIPMDFVDFIIRRIGRLVRPSGDVDCVVGCFWWELSLLKK